MAVIPSFSGFAAAPNLAQAYLGGVEARQSDDKLGLEAARIGLADQRAREQIGMEGARLEAQQARAAEQMALEQQQLQQAAMLAEMQLEARNKELQSRALRDQQKLEIDKSYKDAMIGLKEQEIFMRGTGADYGGAAPIAGLPPNFVGVQTGPETRRIIELPSTDAGAVTRNPELPGYVMYGNKVLPEKEPVALKEAKAKLKLFDTANENDLPAIMGWKEPSGYSSNRIAKLREVRAGLERATIPEGVGTNSVRRSKFTIVPEE